MFQQLKKLSQSSNTTVSDRTLESQADRVYGYALDFLRLRPEQFEIQFEGTAFALLID
jgi:hypothetical protein